MKIRSIALLLALLPASVAAQQFPVVPDKTLIGRVGTGTGSGPAQAVPFATLFSSIPAGSFQLTALANIAAGTVLGNNTGATGGVVATASPLLGIAGTSAGALCFANATSGTVCINPATGALGTAVASLPSGTYNVVGDSLTQTLTNKTFNCANQTSCVVRLGSDVTGTLLAANFGALTGDVTNIAGSYATTIAANAVTNAKLAQAAATTLKGNPTGSPANEQDLTLDATLGFSGTTVKCTTATSSQIGCAKPDNTTITISSGILTAVGAVASSVDAAGATSVTNGINGDCLGQTAGKISNFDCARLSVADQNLSGGAVVTPNNLTAGTSFTLDCGKSPLQWILNSGSFTITAPSVTSTTSQSCAVRVINGSTAANPGTVTLGGFSGKSPQGATFATTATVSAASVSYTNASATIGWTSNTPVVGSTVFLATTGSLPTNFATATIYYVVASTAATSIQVSATPGGSAIVAGSAGSGTQTGYVPSVFDLNVQAINGPVLASWTQVQ